MADFTININMDKKCSECGKEGATDNGRCLECTTKLIIEKMKSKKEV